MNDDDHDNALKVLNLQSLREKREAFVLNLQRNVYRFQIEEHVSKKPP